MLHQLLWAEILLKGGIGIMLAVIPGYTIALAGLPAAGNGFWPRLLGAGMIGFAGCLLLQGTMPTVRTITPAALIVFNLTTAAMLVATLVLGQASATRRGAVLLWSLAVCLGLLSLIEVAYA